MASYELWQTRTRNLIGTFATKAEALAAIRTAAETQGPAFVESILLGHEDDGGRSKTIAQGSELLKLARRGQPAGAGPTSA